MFQKFGWSALDDGCGHKLKFEFQIHIYDWKVFSEYIDWDKFFKFILYFKWYVITPSKASDVIQIINCMKTDHLNIHHRGQANDQNDVTDYWEGTRGVVLCGRDTRDWLWNIGRARNSK